MSVPGEAAAAALDAVQAAAAAGLAVFLRVGAAIAVAPAFGETGVPVRVRLGLALAFTAVVAPAVPEVAAAMARAPARLFLSEPLAGLALGLALRLMVQALQMAGSMAAQAVSLSQALGNAGPEPQPAIAQLMLAAGLALAVAAGLHVHLAALLVLSYGPLPAGRLAGAAELAAWGQAQAGHAFALAFTLAAPFAAAALVYNLALGVINRAMPQLMVAFVGAPALTLGGLALLAIAAPGLLDLWLAAFGDRLANPLGLP